MAATSGDGPTAARLVEPARQVLDRSCQLLEEARQAVLRPDEPDKQQRLAHVAKSVSAALNACINCLPGQKDVDDVIRTITESSQVGHVWGVRMANRTASLLRSVLFFKTWECQQSRNKCREEVGRFKDAIQSNCARGGLKYFSEEE